MAELKIPDLEPDADNLTAALAYAAAGFYVLPVKPDSKHAGSVLGKGWPAKSSRNPKVIASWFAGTDYVVALHVGRSGAVAIDVDSPEKLPDLLRVNIGAAPYQNSRPDNPERGHYVFALPPDRMLGNSAGNLGKGWGEIRGLNGIIIAAPAPDGRKWKRVGPVPVLPDEIAEQLPDGSAGEDSATDEQVAAFLKEHTAATRPEMIKGWVTILTRQIEGNASCHVSTISVMAGAMKEARAGYFDAASAVGAIKPIFINAVALGGSSGAVRTGGFAESEWAGILAWAVGQANSANLDEVRARADEKMPNNTEWLNNIGSGNAEPPPSDGPIEGAPRLWAAVDLRPSAQPRWLARGRLPLAAVSLLVGDEGIGKSLLWVWIIAYVTTGKPCPGFGIPVRDPATVILVVTEDDWSTTVRPRLDVAGADLSMIRVICIEKDGSGAPVFPRDLHLIREASPRPAAIVVDAFVDTAPAMLSLKDPQQARLALHPWKEIATVTDAAVLLLCHTNRVATANARDKYGITGELRKKARMTLFAQTDDEGNLVVGPEKMNTAAPLPASKFTITAVQHFTPTEDHDGTVPLLTYLGESTQTAREHLADNYAGEHDTTGGDAAVAWLASFLAAGPRWSVEVHRAREHAKISEKKLRTAKTRLRVQSRRLGDGPWFMALPEHQDRDPDALPPPMSGHLDIWTSSQVNPDAPLDAPKPKGIYPHALTTCKDSLMPDGETRGHLENAATHCADCGEPLWAPESINRGICEGCRLTSQQTLAKGEQLA